MPLGDWLHIWPYKVMEGARNFWLADAEWLMGRKTPFLALLLRNREALRKWFGIKNVSDAQWQRTCRIKIDKSMHKTSVSRLTLKQVASKLTTVSVAVSLHQHWHDMTWHVEQLYYVTKINKTFRTNICICSIFASSSATSFKTMADIIKRNWKKKSQSHGEPLLGLTRHHRGVVNIIRK